MWLWFSYYYSNPLITILNSPTTLDQEQIIIVTNKLEETPNTLKFLSEIWCAWIIQNTIIMRWKIWCDYQAFAEWNDSRYLYWKQKKHTHHNLWLISVYPYGNSCLFPYKRHLYTIAFCTCLYKVVYVMYKPKKPYTGYPSGNSNIRVALSVHCIRNKEKNKLGCRYLDIIIAHVMADKKLHISKHTI